MHRRRRVCLSLLFWGCPQPVGACHAHTDTELGGCGPACSPYRDQQRHTLGCLVTYNSYNVEPSARLWWQKGCCLGIRALVEIATTFLSPREDQRQTECQSGPWPLTSSCLTPTEGRRAFSEKRKT